MTLITSSEHLDSAWSAASCIPVFPELSANKLSLKKKINLIGPGSMKFNGSLLAVCDAQRNVVLSFMWCCIAMKNHVILDFIICITAKCLLAPTGLSCGLLK